MTIALIVLLVIISLIGLILCSPISYSLKASGRHPMMVDLSVKWLYRLFAFRLSYEEGGPFIKELYILGSMKMGKARDYDEWLEKRIEKEVKEEDLAEKKENEETHTKFEEEEEASYKKRISFSSDGQVLATEYGQDSSAGKPSTESHVETPSKEDSSGHDSNQGQAEKPQDTKGLSQGQKSEKEGLDYLWWKPYILNRAFWSALSRFMASCYNHSKPRSMVVEGKFGFPNPYYMGVLAGILYTRWPQAMKEIELDFVEPSYEGSIYIQGRMFLLAFAWFGLRFVLAKPVRQLIRATGVFFLKWKKAKSASN